MRDDRLDAYHFYEAEWESYEQLRESFEWKVPDRFNIAEYWKRPEKPAGKVRDGWLLTENLGRVDEDGFFTFVGRADDVIISSGDKIGPEEVEETLAGHEGVADASVIGISHEERGTVPKAFVVPAPGHEADKALRESLRDRLADYEYPREIEFVDDLPRTSTENVRRRDLRECEGLVD